jgi:GH15 family glucan-1,4-alpha-glucosidase
LTLAHVRNTLGTGCRQNLARSHRDLHRRICRDGFNAARSFVQSFGSEVLDASLLLLPFVAFLPIDDARDYRHDRGNRRRIDRRRAGTALEPRQWPGRGAFIACTCWLADCLQMQGRTEEARGYFERVLALRNDVGLLSEEWHVRQRRMLGNFPQALSHLALINTA